MDAQLFLLQICFTKFGVTAKIVYKKSTPEVDFIKWFMTRKPNIGAQILRIFFVA